MIFWDASKDPKRPLNADQRERKLNLSDIVVLLVTGFGLIWGIAALLIFEGRP